MAKWSKIWKDCFSKPVVSEQSWLEPSPDMFDNILEGLAENKKKEKGPWLVLFLCIALAILPIAFYYVTSVDHEETKSLVASQSASLNIEATDPSNFENLTRLDDNESFRNSEIIQSSLPKVQSASNPYKEASIRQIVDSNVSGSSSTTMQDLGFKTLLTLPKYIQNNKIRQKHNKHLSMYALNKPVQLLNVPKRNKLSNPVFLNLTDQARSMADLASMVSVEIFGGLNRGVHTLNSNYAFALAPADFYADDGYGWQAGVSLSKAIHSNLSLDLRLSYQTQRYSSGHNSEVIYNTALENDMLGQTYDLTLATPFGFVQSDFVLSRSASYDEQATSLDAIFASAHRVNTLRSDLVANYGIMQFKTWSLSVLGGFGLTYVLDIDNQLRHVNTQHEFINYEGGTIEKDQEGINRIIPNMLTGLAVNKALGRNAICVNMNYRFAGRTFFRQDDFSSQLHGVNVNIGYQIHF